MRVTEIPEGRPEEQHTYNRVFLRDCAGATEAILVEPYLQAGYQARNLDCFIVNLRENTQIRKLSIETSDKSQVYEQELSRMLAWHRWHMGSFPAAGL